MRILLVHNEYAAVSGEEHAVEAIADLLRNYGHEVFWFRRSSAEIARSLVGRAKAFCSGLHNPFAARTLARKLDEIRPDMVQVQNIYPLLSTLIFRPIKERRIPLVMRCPNYRLFCPNGLHLVRGQVCEQCMTWGRELWCLLRNCEGSLFKSTGYATRNAWARITGSILRNVDVFIVQTDFQKRKFVERGIPESRIAVVPGVVVKNGFLEVDGHGDLVTFVGRVSPEKGIEDFIGVARLLSDIPFAVAGSDSGMPGLREISPANIRWFGFLGPKELHELYLRSRIIVIPSRCYEGFPNVAVQAMTYGRPVVGAAIGALTDVIRDGETGLLFEAGNSTSLAAKLSALYGDEKLCHTLGEAGRQRSQTLYSPANVHAALMASYAKAMQRNQDKTHDSEFVHVVGEGVSKNHVVHVR